jgi:hypothetical protein
MCLNWYKLFEMFLRLLFISLKAPKRKIDKKISRGLFYLQFHSFPQIIIVLEFQKEFKSIFFQFHNLEFNIRHKAKLNIQVFLPKIDKSC